MVADAVEHYLHVDIPMTEAGRPMREGRLRGSSDGPPAGRDGRRTPRAAGRRRGRSSRGEVSSVGVNRIVFTYAHNPQPERQTHILVVRYDLQPRTDLVADGQAVVSISRAASICCSADGLACYGEATLGPLVKTYRKAERGGGYRDGLDGLPGLRVRSAASRVSEGRLSGPAGRLGGRSWRLVLPPARARSIRSA